MNTNDNSKLFNNLNLDPIAEVERILGKTSLDNDEMMLAAGLMAIKSQEQNNLLTQIGDVSSDITWESLKSTLKSYGFKFGYVNSFTPYENREEEEIIAYREDGLIVYVNSYSGDSLNSGNIYFEATPKEGYDIKDVYYKVGEIHASGGMSNDKTYCDFHFDIRDGMMWRIAEVCKVANLVPTWKYENKFLWFVNYEEDKVDGYNYKNV